LAENIEVEETLLDERKKVETSGIDDIIVV